MAKTPRKIIQCDLSGQELRVFASAQEAALSCGSSWPAYIHKSIRFGSPVYGYRWKYAGMPLADMPRSTPGARRAVVVDHDGDVETYRSISEASRSLGIGISSIEHSLSTGGKVKGYLFYYQDSGPMISKSPRSGHRPVVSVDDRGRVVDEYPSAPMAAEALGVSPSAIYRCLNRNNPDCKAKGYRFRYKEEQGKPL